MPRPAAADRAGKAVASLGRCTLYFSVASGQLFHATESSMRSQAEARIATDLPKQPKRVAGIHPLLVSPSINEQRCGVKIHG